MGTQSEPQPIEGAPVPIFGRMISCLGGFATYDEDVIEHSKLIFSPESYDSLLCTAIYAVPAPPILTPWTDRALAPLLFIQVQLNASTTPLTAKCGLF